MAENKREALCPDCGRHLEEPEVDGIQVCLGCGWTGCSETSPDAECEVTE